MKKIILSFSLILIISILGLKVFKQEKVLNDELLTNKLDSMVGVYLEDENGEYVSSSDIPQKDAGYTFNHAVCENNVEVTWDEINWTLLGPSNTTNWKCNLYFDKDNSLKGKLLANYSTILTRKDFSQTITETTTGTIYYEETNKGTTYYFVGNPTDNYVRFAGIDWRIIRINEDGSLRLIYQNDQIRESPFNRGYTDNMYVGYMYQYEQLHGLEESSTIKGELDNWYYNNLRNYADKIDGNAGFCNDRTPYKDNGEDVYYGAYYRLQNYMPTFECANDSDLFTTKESVQGNKALQYPIGLITADEVAYAGGVYDKINESFYLYTGRNYWTITPSDYNVNAGIFRIDLNGTIDIYRLDLEYSVRPVINLKADVQISSGTGTASDPYIIN